MAFLSDVELRALSISESQGLRPIGLALGLGPQALEVALVETQGTPTQGTLKAVWRARVGGRATPVLLVALHDNEASLCGPTGEDPLVYLNQDAAQAEQICRIALSEPDRHAALRFLRLALDSIGTPFAGLRNEGLFATHALYEWRRGPEDSRGKGEVAARLRRRELMKALGYEVQTLDGPVSVLLAGPRRVAVAAFLDQSEVPDIAATRFSNVSPASYALSRADSEGLDWVIIAAGPLLRLYPARPNVGVGKRGRTETYVELHLGLLPNDKTHYLWDLFSAEALVPKGTVEQLLEDSTRYGTDLGARLRVRIYDEAIPHLATALARARQLISPTQQQLEETYQMALTLLFRILFVAYGEDRDLLPYRTNERYRVRSLKEKSKELAALAERGVSFDSSSSHWEESQRLFRAIDKGSSEWGIPEYNGGLFSEDASISPVGAALTGVSLSNEEFGPLLRAILVDETPEGFVPVDFRSLGVRDFGTIYEGLLESELSVAETDLDVDERGSYVPTRIPEPVVRQGEIYLHNKSGARKATGSYFTKAFAVDHLLDHSLEPALEEHVARLDQLPDDEAGDAFFDFRVADIAMGSGHFLVAAVDRIERRLSDYLTKRPLLSVQEELARLRGAAKAAVPDATASAEIEDMQLLRRQIARRCIYGVDLNPLAVELARLSLWVHTFVPGLPLSFLDHHLVQGNSLVGIGTLDEARELVEAAAGGPMFSSLANELMNRASEAMARVGRLADADAAEIAQAREAYQRAREAESPLTAILDILAASRLAREIKVDPGTLTTWQEDPRRIPGSELHRRANEAMAGIPPFHFPVAFPEVFQRERPGFDVIIGNPPWEKTIPKEDSFWSRFYPGFSGQPQHEREVEARRLRNARPDLAAILGSERRENEFLRAVLSTGPYPGMGTGDPDLYKAFCWRFWHLARPQGGRIGVVLPRSAWNAKGSTPFRGAALQQGTVEDLTFLLNNMQWIFEDVHPQYTIALASLERTPPGVQTTLPLRGPFRSRARFDAGIKKEPVRFPVAEVLRWTDTAALPLLPTEESAEVFAQLRKAPRLDLNDGSSWRARPYSELHATNDKHLMTFAPSPPPGYWPVFKGESFDIWEADKGPASYYAWVEPAVLVEHLYQKRLRASRSALSPFSEFPKAWLSDRAILPCLHPRIAFRDVSRASDTRTVRAALLPPRIAVTHAAPYILFARGDEMNEAFLLGVLCSIPLDWYARCFVEVNLTYNFFNPLPVPRPVREDPLWQRAVALAGRLACPDERFAQWAQAVGVDWGPLDPGEKLEMIWELDAVVTHLYGLSEGQLRHIFETFHEGWQYGPRLEATLRLYRAWREKL